ncbi:MAG: hypothetical protein RL701_6348 [Pseudomonadota bacterium]|jgi:hypothetical protein
MPWALGLARVARVRVDRSQAADCQGCRSQVVVIAHMGVYLDNSAQALPALTPLAVHTFGFCLAAVGVVMRDRKVWRVGALAHGD